MTAPAPPIHVDVWTWRLDIDDGARQRLGQHLSDDEAARAQRFVFERDRNRFIVARGRLREILAERVGGTPKGLRFAYAAHGKPTLEGPKSIHFNLSHAEALAALAICDEREIGADIEFVRPLKEDVAGRFFSKSEVAALRALPESEQLDAFYRCWTRKEAIVKAIGEGLSHSLDSFDVTLSRADAPSVQRFEGEREPSRTWRLAHFEPQTGYLGAVACRTEGRALAVLMVN